MKSTALTVLAAAAVTGLAADFTLLVDDREVVAQGSASDFNGFDFSSDDLLPEVEFQEWFVGAGGFGAVESADGSGSSSQESSMGPAELAASGDASASAFSDGEGYGLGFAYSRYSVVFSVDEPTRVLVNATLEANGESRSWVRILNESNTRIYDEDASQGPRSIDEAVTLPTGTYTFQLRTDASKTFNFEPGSGSASGDYAGSLSIAPGCSAADLAEPAGVLDLADVQGFVAAFLSGTGEADLANPSGVLDLADLQAFIGLFLAGCP